MLYSNQLPLFEYNLRISPPHPVYAQLMDMKCTFIKYFGPGLYSKSTPFITVASFYMDSRKEQPLIDCLHNTLTQQIFPVSINKISGFKDIRMVMVDVGYNQVLVSQMGRLQKALRNEMRIPSKYVSVVDRFHIAIGQASNSLDYSKAIQLLSTLKLDWEFMATDLVLMKKPLGQPVSWQRCYEFALSHADTAVA